MRSEQEMLALILDTAQNDDRIRAVMMNGSRANPNASRDPFQDFDVVYFVTDVAPYRHNLEWIGRFGELMILQMPEGMVDPPPEDDGRFAYLMQFSDGNRIDLTLYPLDKLDEMGEDSLGVVLLDKDNLFDELPPASEASYLPPRPAAKAFADCCNEFWWLCPYVAKGLWRGELPYAHFFLEANRDQLVRIVNWFIGVETDFAVNPGKFGKDLERYLASELWEMFQATYTDLAYDNMWRALFAMGALFREVARPVAGEFGFDYPQGDDERVSAHLRHVYRLARDAAEIY